MKTRQSLILHCNKLLTSFACLFKQENVYRRLKPVSTLKVSCLTTIIIFQILNVQSGVKIPSKTVKGF